MPCQKSALQHVVLMRSQAQARRAANARLRSSARFCVKHYGLRTNCTACRHGIAPWIWCQVRCRVSPGDVSLAALVYTARGKIAARLGVDQDFDTFCDSERGRAAIEALLAEHAARTALDLPLAAASPLPEWVASNVAAEPAQVLEDVAAISRHLLEHNAASDEDAAIQMATHMLNKRRIVTREYIVSRVQAIRVAGWPLPVSSASVLVAATPNKLLPRAAYSKASGCAASTL